MDEQRKKEYIQQPAAKKEPLPGEVMSIAEGNLAEEALKENNKLFRGMFEGHQDMMLLIEPKNGLIIDANSAAIKFYGYPLQVLRQMKMRDINQLPRSQLKEQSRAMLSGQRTQHIFPHRLANGEIRTVEVHATPVKISHREVLFSIIHDISERKRAEESLRESEEKYRSLVEQSVDGFAMVNSHGIITEWNNSEAKITGLNRNEVTGRPLWEVNYSLLPDERKKQNSAEQMKSAMMEMLRTKKSPILNRPGELIIIRPDGIQRTVLLRLFMVNLSNDFLVGSISTDITELKKAEEELARAKAELEIKVKERTHELKESEEKYRRIVENAGEGIIAIAPDGIINFVNPRIPEMFGFVIHEMLGKSVLNFVAQEDRKKLKNQLDSRTRGVVDSYEIRFRRKDNSLLWVRVKGTPFFDEKGQHAGSLGLLTDVTEEKKLLDRLKDYAKKITRVQEEERKRIAYELHDDTAQYLSIIKLELDALLQSGKIQSPEVLEKLQYLEKDTDRAFNDVRRYSHELRPAVLDHLGLQAALEQIAEDINKLKEITLRFTAEGEEPELSDEVKLALFRIAQEALSNARKHSKASNAIIKLQFFDKRVKLSVIDDGIGFDVQEATVRSTLKGSLGLTSMQERAELIGADLKIDSRPGKGTTVTAEISL
jgi:PAS domain S-box-containing protein